MRNKKGIIGSFVGLFFSTAVIVVILILFVLAAGILKGVNEIDSGVEVVGLKDTKISELETYDGFRLVVLEKKELIKKSEQFLGHG